MTRLSSPAAKTPSVAIASVVQLSEMPYLALPADVCAIARPGMSSEQIRPIRLRAAAIANTRSYPAVSAMAVLWPPARAVRVVATATVASAASPSDPPIWRKVLSHNLSTAVPPLRTKRLCGRMPRASIDTAGFLCALVGLLCERTHK
jgi:hypothetical protein